jgi:hypothetical protein
MTSSGVPIIAVGCRDSGVNSGRSANFSSGLGSRKPLVGGGLVSEPGVERPVELVNALGRAAPTFGFVRGMDVGVAEHHEVGAGDAWVVFDGGIELVCEVFDVLVALLRRANDDAHDQALNLMQLLSPMINVVKSETLL